MASKSLKLNEDQLKALRSAFALIDRDSDGKLSINEFLFLFESQQMNYSENELRKFFSELNPDSNGCIDFNGFYDFMFKTFSNPTSYANNVLAEKPFDPTNPKDLIELTIAFARLDINSDGRISKKEFEQVFQSHGMSQYESDAFFYALEPDESGCIDFKEFVKIMSGGYQPDEKIIAKNMFVDFDKDKDGLISFDEFKEMAKFFLQSSKESELKQDFDQIDKNGDGKLSLEEFVEAVGIENKHKDEVITIDKIFSLVDSDKDGFINFDEFKKLAIRLNVNLSEDDLKVDFECSDENEDKKISFKEFLEWYGSLDKE